MAENGVQTVFVNQFEISFFKKVISRVYFYGTTALVFWLVGNLLPNSSEVQAQIDRNIGAAKAYIGTPIEEVPLIWRQ